jgi:type I restriction enzyme S subunit
VLGKLGKFYGGLNGKSKDDFTKGNAAFITYKNVYSNPALDLDPEDTVKIGEDENQRTLEYGDVVFTGSSETPNECGFSAVVTKTPEKELYLNSFCFFFRFYDISCVEPDFLKHLFRSHSLRCQIGKTASGVTRFNVSKKKMEKIQIPLPPIEIQREIVRILDNFTELTAELTAELTDRKKQYEYYRDSLLSNNKINNNVLLKSVVKKSCSGGTPKKDNREFYSNGTVPWLRTQDVKFNEIYKIDSFITEEAVKKTSAKWIPANCVIVAISGATAGRCAINKIPTTTNQHCYNMEIDETKALYKYVYYCVCSQHEELLSKKQGARGDLNSTLIMGIEIPIPYPNEPNKSLEEQQRIVDILDRFDTLCNDISSGLPAEIELRQKQYEYYRDKLLTFPKEEA